MLKVYLANPSRTIFKSTDHHYINTHFVQIQDHFPVKFVKNDAWFSRQYTNGKFLASRVIQQVVPDFELDARYPAMNSYWCNPPGEADVIFSYGGFPFFNGKKPIVTEQTYAPANYFADGTNWLEHIRKQRRIIVERSDFLCTPSPMSKEYFLEAFPDQAEKMHCIPYYMPHLRSISDQELDKKYDHTDKIKLLFVGKEAKRKGLPVVLEAWEKLNMEERDRFEVTVISKFLDGEMALPPEWHHYSFVDDITAEFKKAQVFLFPTTHEAYGLVLVESMAYGCAFITTDHPIQKSIANQKGGWFVNPHSAEEMLKALREVLSASNDDLLGLGKINLENFRSEKSPEVVGKKYYELFQQAASVSRQPISA